MIARRCGEISGFTFEGSDLYLRLRRVLNEDAGIESEDSANNDADNEEDGEMASDAVSTKEANFKFSYAYSEFLCFLPKITTFKIIDKKDTFITNLKDIVL